ncbi:MAG: glycosyltransferase [Candidatus Methanomethylicaceae archaeon]
MDRERLVIIVTQLDMQRAGNQILFRTVQGYLNKRYKVILFTSNPESDSNRADYKTLLGKHVEDLVVYRFDPLFRKLWKILRIIKRIEFVLKICQKKNTNVPKVEETVPFVDTTLKASLIGFLSQVSFFLGGFLKLFKLVRMYNPVVIYGYEIYGAPLALCIAKMFHIPLITKYQGTIAYPIIEKYKNWAWFKIPHHIIGLKSSIFANLVIMENDGTKGKDVLIKLGVSERNIRFWIDGVKKDIYILGFDKRKFHEKLCINENAKIILLLCKLKKWKRVDRAIVAMEEVVKKYKDAVLVIVGDGPERENLKLLVEKLNLNDNVLFVGFVPHEEISKYLNACDIFLSLNDYSNLCNPVLEALECGKAIITIDDGSTKEILVNNQNAILIKKDELSKKLSDAILRLLTDDNFRENLEKNAKIFAEKHLLSWGERMELEIKEVEKVL